MEIRVLRNFIALAETGSFTAAAKRQHITQPALSTQIKELEEETGHILLERGKRNISLTPTGRFMLKKAQHIVNMADNTINELNQTTTSNLKGKIEIVTSEAMGFRFISSILKDFIKKNPEIIFSVHSTGSNLEATNLLQHDKTNFAILFGEFDREKYNFLELPCKLSWGLLLNHKQSLYNNKGIQPDDLKRMSLIVPRYFTIWQDMQKWLPYRISNLKIIGTYDLGFNAYILAQENIGAVVSPNSITTLGNNYEIIFSPFNPQLESSIYLVWKKNIVLPPIMELFYQAVTQTLDSYDDVQWIHSWTK